MCPTQAEARSIVAGGCAPEFENSLREACRLSGSISFAGNLKTPEQLIEAAGSARPQLVFIADDWLRDLGLGLLARLRDTHEHSLVLVQGREMGAMAIAQALPLGLRGVVPAGSSAETVARAVTAVLEGDFWFSHGEIAQVLELLASSLESPLDETWHKLPALTDRERAVLVELLAGQSNKEISEKLLISEQTVKVHVQHVFTKLGVHRRTDLLAARPKPRLEV